MPEEVHFARFEGGILDGQTIRLKVWPPPEKMDGESEVILWREQGAYLLKSKSQLEEPHPNIARSALYGWVQTSTVDPPQTEREAREEMEADTELMADEFHGWAPGEITEAMGK